MAKMRPCPFCGGKHRTKKAARKCYASKHGGGKPWANNEVGY